MSSRAVASLVALALIACVFVWWQETRGGVLPGHSTASQVAIGTEPPRLAGNPKRPVHANAQDVTAPVETASDAEAPEQSHEEPRHSLRVDVVEAETGLPVAATWNFGRTVVAAPSPPGAVIDEAAIAAEQEWLRKSQEQWEAGFVASGEVREGVLLDGDWMECLKLHLPSGYVSEDPKPRFPLHLANGVRATYAVVPAYREAMLDLRILDPRGRPADKAEVSALEVAGTPRLVIEEDLGPGLIRLRGIPFLAGEPVIATLEWGNTGASGDLNKVPRWSDALSDPEIATRVPSDLAGPWVEVVSLIGPTWPRFPRCPEVNFRECLFGLTPLPSLEEGTGTVRALAVGWDGSVVRGAVINGKAVDAKGEVTFQQLPAAVAAYNMSAPGRLPATVEVGARPGETTEVFVREPMGARLDVLVTDEAGQPRPFARIQVTRLVLDVVGGVQRLDMFTDAGGFRSFARVEPGPTHVTATWGSRRGAVDTTLRDGEPTTLVIVAK